MSKKGTIELLLDEQERLVAENRRLSAELVKSKQVQNGELPGPTRTHIRRIEAERDTALAEGHRLRKALEAMQALLNSKPVSLWQWWGQECRAGGINSVYMAIEALAMLAGIVFVVASVVGVFCGGA